MLATTTTKKTPTKSKAPDCLLLMQMCVSSMSKSGLEILINETLGLDKLLITWISRESFPLTVLFRVRKCKHVTSAANVFSFNFQNIIH